MTARSTFHGILAVLALAGAAVISPAVAATGGEIVLADSRMSMDQAVKMAERKFKARVVRAESQDQDGKVVYVLRLLNDSGRVWTVKIDAATGSVI